ncbi:hypothetical protein PLESTB_001517900 [Pleodorina starrii]|uniref:Peptidase M11 gametolysin domain-containing protein n=1 Tax=Pleodorina starrii TaxID=330485 RepID=A0A9W6BWS5_9CHLO|nr:hypothetical protein PLESTB_001517900 [Pleodorina starrii]
MFISHPHPNELEPADPTLRSTISWTLVDTRPAAADTPPEFLNVTFGEKGASPLQSGDVVVARLTLTIPAKEAAKLDLMNTSDIIGTSSKKSSRRRQLSDRHETARRMVLDFHNTRRSVRELISLRDALGALGISYVGQQMKSETTTVIEKVSEKDLFVIDGVQQSMSSIVFLVKVSGCGMTTKMTLPRVEDWLFINPRIYGNLERWYKVCTYDQVTYKREANPIFEVTMPCKGTTPNNLTFDFQTGYANKKNMDNEIHAMAEMSQSWLLTNRPDLQWNKHRKMFLFPFNWDSFIVGWGGLATMGCKSYDLNWCYTWINLGQKDVDVLNLATTVQELNHNIGLAHSSNLYYYSSSNTWGKNEYGDNVCPMGGPYVWNYEQAFVCTNAAQSYKAGWAKPIPGGHIDAYNLVPEVTQRFTLPSTSLSKNNILRIIYDRSNREIDNISAPVVQDAIIVSYRVRQQEFDSGLEDDKNRRVWIHQYNHRFNGQPARVEDTTIMIAVLSDETPLPSIQKPWWQKANRTFTQMFPAAVGGFTVTMTSKTETQATVAVCRFLNKVETRGDSSCSDGRDNDCDGLVDMDDTDCRESPPPSPPLPRPPLPRPPPPPPPLPSPPPVRMPRQAPPPPRPRWPRYPPDSPLRPPRPPRPPRPSPPRSTTIKRDDAADGEAPPSWELPSSTGSAAHCHTCCCVMSIFLAAVLCAVLQWRQ